MPERKLDGICPDCEEGFENKELKWEGSGRYSVVDGNCEVVEWAIAHHKDKPMGRCSMVSLMDGKYDLGYVLVTRLTDGFGRYTGKFSVTLRLNLGGGIIISN